MNRAKEQIMSDEKADLIAAASRLAMDYLSSNNQSRVFPSDASLANLAGFDSALPHGGTDPTAILELLDRVGSPATVRSTSGRYFGFVTGNSEPIATAAAILALAWDQNIAVPVMSPVAARLDTIATRWVCELLGLPPTATAVFCAGASVANLTCILAARDALLNKSGWDVNERGLFGAPEIPVIVSAESHITVDKALRNAGFGRQSILRVETDGLGRMRADRLPPLTRPSLVVMQAGNVNTGHSDPFADVIPAVQAAGGWVHVDGAFGLWAAVSPRQRHLVAGAELADSWATDAHKWLNASYDSGVAICRREEDLSRAMSVDGAYVPSSNERVLMKMGLQMSQRARAIEAWAIIATQGQQGLAAMIDRHCDFALLMAERLVASGAELLAPVGLNQILLCFGNDQRTDDVIGAVQADGTCWAGGTTWKGRRAMRVSICDTSTSLDDVERSIAAIIKCSR